MNLKFPYFPWRLFFKLFLTLLGLLNLLFIGALGFASYQFDFEFYTARPLIFVGVFLLMSAIGSAWFAYRFVTPLRRIIIKALRIANKKYANEFDEEDVLIDEPGEYEELEEALDKIRKKLKKRRLQLSHEREESQALASSMDDGILSIDLEQRLNFFNSRFAAQFLTRDLIQSKNDGQTIRVTQCFRQPEVLQLFQRALAQGEVFSEQVRLPTLLDHQPKFFSIRVSPLREEKTREIYGTLAVFHDISEIKKAEQIRIEFVENASHELRTPLTSVKGYVAMLHDDVQNQRWDQMPQFLGIIEKNVDRLTELVNDMLTISKLENRDPLKIETINALVITEDVISRLSPIAVEKKILLKLNIQGPTEFSADPHKVEQVLLNLIGNAIKYIPEGGQVEIRWEDHGSENLALVVKDNGPGISLEHHARLFERFYRVDKGRSRDVGGTGLGLAIVKHIMQSHGGSVQLQSEPGQGTEFTCLFPRLRSI